ncbi:hypothetical protein ACU686_27300 [Yinghuangia aomiensis]
MLLGDPGAEVEAEPRDAGKAAEAVRLLDAGLRGGPAAMRVAVERTQETADGFVVADRLQVFSELVQNADDAGAMRDSVRRTGTRTGRDARRALRCGSATFWLLALPGLSGKSGDPDSTGRFGIGLATLRAPSRVWELHCGHYHVRFDGIGMTVADAYRGGDGGTVFRIPLAESEIRESRSVAAWFCNEELRDDGALLFLRNLGEVRVDVGGRAAPQAGVALVWRGVARPDAGRGSRRRGADAPGGEGRRARGACSIRRNFPARDGALRRHKAVGVRVPVAIALPAGNGGGRGRPCGAADGGARTPPVRVHTQFDPLVSRRDFVDSAWNSAMVERVADLWAAVIPGVLGGDARRRGIWYRETAHRPYSRAPQRLWTGRPAQPHPTAHSWPNASVPRSSRGRAARSPTGCASPAPTGHAAG